MTVTVRELITYLENNCFQDDATIRVEDVGGPTLDVDDVKKDINGNPILMFTSDEDDSDNDLE